VELDIEKSGVGSTLGNTGFLDFVHRPVFQKLEKTTFRKGICFHSQVRGKTPTLLRPLERANLNHSKSTVNDQSNDRTDIEEEYLELRAQRVQS
jgi:hypothetical protein